MVVSICVRAHSKVRARKGRGDLPEPGQSVVWPYVSAKVCVGENHILGCNPDHGHQMAWTCVISMIWDAEECRRNEVPPVS